ncbi:MAG: hypothetical protein ABR878_08620 [Roseiarcus sp.]|jgi:hypothetical protein
MIWDQVEVSWKQLKDKVVFQWSRLTDDNGKRFDLLGAEMSRDGQSGDAQIANFRPDQDVNRSGFSLHIGC